MYGSARFTESMKMAIHIFETKPNAFPDSEKELKEKLLSLAAKIAEYLSKDDRYSDISLMLLGRDSSENLDKLKEFIKTLPLNKKSGLF